MSIPRSAEIVLAARKRPRGLVFALLHPGFLFSALWLTVLGLYQFQFSELLVPLTPVAAVFILLSCVCFLLPSCGLLLKPIPFSRIRLAGSYDKTRRLKGILIAWLILSVIEVAIARTLPIIGILGVGPYLPYTMFGIPSLHGLANAILLVLSNYSFYFFLQRRKKRYAVYYLLCLLWPILLVSRQVIMSGVIQAFFIYLFYLRKNRLSRAVSRPPATLPVRQLEQRRRGRSRVSLVKLVLIVALVGFVFSTLGNVRQQGGTPLEELARLNDNYPRYLPSGFLWAYLYLTSPLSNVVNNLDRLIPNYLPVASLGAGLPSVIRGQATSLFGDRDSWELVVEYMNVSSFHQPFLTDFGIFGALLAYVILATGAYVLYHKSNSSRLICWQFAYVVVAHDIFLSTFTNFFTHAAFLAQIMIHLLLQIRLTIK